MAVATLKKIKPLSDRVLVKPLEKEQEKKGGIIILRLSDSSILRFLFSGSTLPQGSVSVSGAP